jgi:hypothetical protein
MIFGKDSQQGPGQHKTRIPIVDDGRDLPTYWRYRPRKHLFSSDQLGDVAEPKQPGSVTDERDRV